MEFPLGSMGGSIGFRKRFVFIKSLLVFLLCHCLCSNQRSSSFTEPPGLSVLLQRLHTETGLIPYS